MSGAPSRAEWGGDERVLTPSDLRDSVSPDMHADAQLRIEPAPEILDGARRWLEAARGGLGSEFLAAYLTGSVLTQGFDAEHSHVNVLVVARELPATVLDSVARALPARKKRPFYEALFFTRRQIEKSLDSFPIEWIEILERHLRLDGEDVLTGLTVPRANLRLQLEHELRAKHLQLRQEYLYSGLDAEILTRALRSRASSFAALFRTLLRLQGESAPADSLKVYDRVATLYGLDPQGLLSAHLVRYSTRSWKLEEIRAHYLRFMNEIDRVVDILDDLRV